MTIRQWLKCWWHTRPGHSPGLITTPHHIYCAGCGSQIDE